MLAAIALAAILTHPAQSQPDPFAHLCSPTRSHSCVVDADDDEGHLVIRDAHGRTLTLSGRGYAAERRLLSHYTRVTADDTLRILGHTAYVGDWSK